MKCGKCDTPLELSEQCWIRITDQAGGKIKERPVCEKCARKIAALLGDYWNRE